MKISFQMIYLVNCFTRLLDQSLQFGDVVGAVHRIGRLQESLLRIHESQTEQHVETHPATIDTPAPAPPQTHAAPAALQPQPRNYQSIAPTADATAVSAAPSIADTTQNPSTPTRSTFL